MNEKIQCLLFVLRRSYNWYDIISMTVPLTFQNYEQDTST